jgi:hypothetical protein
MGTVLAMVVVAILFSTLLPAVLPLLLHLITVSVFLLSKLVRPLLRKPTELLLLRFYESEKGILTLLAVGVGAAAELITKAIKYAAS